MARLWSSGFELQSATAGIEVETIVGSPSINTTIKRSGAASLRCNPTAASAHLRHTLMTGTTTSAHVYLRAYVYIASLPTANTMLMGWIDSSPFGYGVRLTTAGKLQIGGTNSVLIGTASTTTLSTGQWYRIELDYDDATDVATCYVDGASACTLSAADTFGGALALFGLFDSCTADVYFDDIAVNDNSGSVQNGLAGAGSIVHLKPSAAGDNNGFATAVGGTAGAANNYTRVLETTPDDLTTYNNTTLTGTTTIDDFNVTDSSAAGIGSGDSVTLVQVGQRAGSGAVTTASIVTRIKAAASGTVAESASIPVNVNGFRTYSTVTPYTYKLTAYVKPSSTAWTPTDLDSMQIGYRGNVAQTTSRRITTLWALVEYVPVEVHTTSGTARADAGSTGTSSTVRTTSGTARADAGGRGTESTIRTTAGTASATATATGSGTTVRTTTRTAQALAGATGTESTVRTTTGTGFAAASASGMESTIRTTAGTAGAVARATYTSSSDIITAGTASATAGASGTSSTVRTTAGTGFASASSSGTDSTVRTTAGTASATAGGRSTGSTVRTTAGTAPALAGASGTLLTVRITAGTVARALAGASGTSSTVISAIKVRESGAWVSAAPKVRESGAWVAATPNRRESGAWVPY